MTPEKQELHAEAQRACQRGNELRTAGVFDQAAREFERALSLVPEEYSALLGLALVRSAQARHGEAIARLTELTVRHPRKSEPWSMLGEVLIAAGRAVDALAPLQRYASLVPHDPTVHLRCAELALDLGADDVARDLIERVQSVDPSNAIAMWLAGRTRFEEGETEAAIGMYRTAAVAAPDIANPSGGRITEAWLMRLPDWARSGLGEYHRLAPPSVVELPAPNVLPSEEAHHWPAQTGAIPEIFIGVLDNAEVYTPEFTVRASDGIFFVDGFVTSPAVYLKKRGIVKYASRDGRVLLDLPHDALEVPGGCALLGRSNNYSHFVLESVARIWCLEQIGVDSRISALVPADLHAAELELLALLGFPDDRLIKLTHGSAARCQTLYAPSLLGQGHLISPIIVTFLRQRVLARTQPSQDYPRRIYLSRDRMPRRRVRDEHKLRERLETHGFVSVHPEELSFREQANMFARAEAILSPDSSALANLPFVAPGADIGVFSRRGLYLPFWQCIAFHAGARLTYIHADAIVDSHANLAHCDMYVQPALVDAWLETLH